MAGYAGTHSHPGVGRKPKKHAQRILDGTANAEQRMVHAENQREQRAQNADGSTSDHAETSLPSAHDHVPMPAWLRPDEKRIWKELAPLALAAHTLTPQTAIGFRTLVETRAARLKIRRIIEREGWVRRKGENKGKRHPLLTEHRNLLTLETTAMLRFCLHAAGREMDFVSPVSATPDGPTDKWAKFDTPPPTDGPPDDTATTH